MRIVSLLPSATEVLFALGLDEEIVGVSHECDYPLRAKTKTAVVSSRIPKDATPVEIDRLVREHVERGESIYAVNRELLEELKPDLIFTQDLCHVCAATPEELAGALATISKQPEIISLDPHDLGDVWRDILWIGEATGRRERAQRLVTRIGERLGHLSARVARDGERPKAVVLEWLQPFYVGGHWVPEMVEHAGGVDVLGKAKVPSRRITLEEIVAAAPEVIFIAPCGYNAEQTRNEYLSLTFPEEWHAIPAVRDGRVYALDANGHVSRPAGRLVTGTESMAKGLYPEIEVPVKAMLGMVAVSASGTRNRTAAASAPNF
ncbi:MAG TPA: cobalamin-binding protein [Candidatus Eisenbacteria bacterium]|nr:cobalamin-binding protein [Candidatus Eisenbacteria bacterium]